MALEAGTHLGPYDILAPLGAGGMGEVYRARDTKLGREVAVKILPDEFAKDPERLARFEREARSLAALNHPGILSRAAIYGLEEDDGTQFLVLELVEGETLAQRLFREIPAAPEALQICRQIAEALEAAHEKGLIHRDLKPANVKVITPNGRVKVLDFGLAKAVEPDASPTRDLSTSADAHRRWATQYRRDPRHRRLHEPGAGARASPWTSAPTSGRSAACSSRRWHGQS